MADEMTPANPDRDQTDESLRAEREKADGSGGDPLDGEAVADALVQQARERADAVLAEARERMDRHARAAGLRGTISTAAERGAADSALAAERALADEALREERADLTNDRAATDMSLSVERARSDEALETRDDLLGVVSHDLRNMLGAVLGFAGLIAEGGPAATQLEYAHRIQRAGGRMNRLIGDLVDVASIEAGVLAAKREAAAPTLLVTEAVEAFQAQLETRGISLTTEVVAPIPSVALDAARILQVLVNLLSNAVKFTPMNGAIVVRLERLGEEVRFSVSDTGAGIPGDQLETIFGRYHQVERGDRRGVGLGLYISKCIVEGHGGRIWAESTEGTGSRVCFTVPCAQA